MGKSEPRRARSVVGIDEDSEEEGKPLAQVVHHRQSHDEGEAAADRAPKRQRTASDDGGRRARGATAAEHGADQQQAEPAAAAAADAAADDMEVDEPEQQQEEEAAAAEEQCNSKEPDTPFAVMKDAFPGLQHGHSSGDGAAAAADAAPGDADAPPAAPAAAGSGRQWHSGRQHKPVQQQQLQSERTLSRSLSGRPSFKLSTRVPQVAKSKPERAKKARLPWEGADENWGEGCDGVSFTPPAGAEPVVHPPLREAAVGWGFWLFYQEEEAEDGQQEGQEQQEEQQQQQQRKGPMPGNWYRGMVWWFSAKEAAYKFIMEDGEYVPRCTVKEMEDNFKNGEMYFCKPPRGWPPQHALAEQQSGLSADAHAEQQEEGQELEHEAAASGKRAKQHKAKQERQKPQQQQPQQMEEDTGPATAAAAVTDANAKQAAAAAEEHVGEQQANPAKQQQQQQQQQQHHQKQPKQQQHQHQQRLHSGQQQKKPQQQQRPHSQGHKQRKHSAGTAVGSRPAGFKPHPPPSPAVAGAEAAAAAAAATAAAAGLSTPASAGGGAAGQQRPRSASVRPQQQQQQQPDLSGLTGDAARLAICLIRLRDGTEAVKKGLALQKQALQELSTGVHPDRICELAGVVKRALNNQQESLGTQLLMSVKHLAQTQPQCSQEVDSSAQQLYQQLKQGRKPPGTPSKALAGVKQEGEWGAAAAAAGMSLQDMEAAGAGGLGKRGRDGHVKQEAVPAAAAAEQRSPSEQQEADDDAAAAAGVDTAGKDTWDIAHLQSLVPVRTLDDPLREKAVALLSAVLQPPAAASPFKLAHELEAKLHNQHGMIGPGKHMYLRHLYMIWCVLGGRELTAAAEAAQRARNAAAEAAADSNADGTAAAAADKAAAAAARAELEGVPGMADAAAVRTALLEGAASVEELFAMTRTQLGFDQQRDK